MEIESIGPYSPSTVYGQLSSPFEPKTVTVNAKTPYDKVDENSNESEVFSRKFFKGKPVAKMKIDINQNDDQNKNPLLVKQNEFSQSNSNEINSINKDQELY